MKKWHRLLALLLPAIYLTACSGPLPKQVNERSSDDQSFVFGYIDMEDAPTGMRYLTMKQVKPRIADPYLEMRVHEGAFYNEAIKPGSYQLAEFGGQNCLFGLWFPCGDPYRYFFPQQMDGFRLEKPGMHFLGSYRYKRIKHFFRQDEFDIERVDGPGEAEVLRRVLPYTEGTSWKARVEARIQELKG